MSGKRAWTAAQEAMLRELWPTHTARQLAPKLRKSAAAVKSRATLLRLKKPMEVRRHWTAVDDRRLRKLYPDTDTAVLARKIGARVGQVYRRVIKLGLIKSAVYMQEKRAKERRRLSAAGEPHRFKKGMIPANNGRKGSYAPGSEKGWFKKGSKTHSWLPIGSERFSKERYLLRKVADTGYPPRDWQPVHRLIWIAKHGPIPDGYRLAFVDGDRTHIALENLELRSLAEFMRRNSYHNYPAPISEAIMLRAALVRKINRRKKREEPHNGSA